MATPFVALLALGTACSSSGASGSAATTSTGTSAEPTWLERPPSTVQVGGGAVSVFPSPGTAAASPKSEISIRGVDPAGIGSVTVVGSKSGRHAGRLVAHADGHGASFVLSKPFAPGEHVHVATKLHVRGAAGGSYGFTVARPAAEPPPAPVDRPAPTGKVVGFVTQPKIRMTGVKVTVNRPGQAPGLIFVAPRRGAGADALELLDGNGRLVWFNAVPRGLSATDLRMQTFRGRPVITWWQGRSAAGHGRGRGIVVDDTYTQIATVHAGNGYEADLHELELTSANTAFVTAYRVVDWDLSSVGGPRNGLAVDCIAQEVEVGTGRVLFEWHSLGNVPLSDGYGAPPTDRSAAYDYFHINSITSDDEGNVLISGRGTHALYEIDPRTGAIRWRIGGKHSDFKLGPGVSFHSQHDATWAGPRTLSLFDNGAGAGGNPHKESRGLVLHVDAAAGKVTLLKQFRQPRDKLFSSQGNIEQLPNGDWFVGWGEGPYATEFAPDGRAVWALEFASGASYRAYRYPWHARPRTKPSVVVGRRGGTTQVTVSWNGATDVARWQLLGGSSVETLAPLATAPRGGFETTIRVKQAPAVVAVRALDAARATLATSRPVRKAGLTRS